VTNDVNEGNSATKISGTRGFEKVVIVIIIIGFAAGLIYQVFFCSTCYGITQRFVPVVPATEKTELK
jgi:hypothetical protein